MRFTVMNGSVRGTGGVRSAVRARNGPGGRAVSSGGRRRRSIAHKAARESLRTDAAITGGHFPFFSFFLCVRGPLPIFFESFFFAFLEGYSYAGSASSVSGSACTTRSAAAPKRPAKLPSMALRRVLTRSPFATVQTRPRGVALYYDAGVVDNGGVATTGGGYLGPLEAEVMRVLWAAKEPLTVRAVLERLNRGRRPPLAYTTVMTVMARLAEKEVLRRERAGRGYAYEAAVPDEAAIAVRDLVRDYGDAAVAQFVDEARADPRLRRRLERLMREKQ
jgi:predicted transcriptional regulator